MRPLAATLLAACLVLGLAPRARAQSSPSPQQPLRAWMSAPGPRAVHAVPTAPSAAPPTTDPAPLCPVQALAPHRFLPGEKMRFHLDVFGADVGTLEVWLEAPVREERGQVALVAHARAKTSAFMDTNVGAYETFAVSRIGPELAARQAREEVDDSGTHWVHELSLPPKLGRLEVHESKNGEPQPLSLAATPSARDLLSTFIAIRAIPLTPGSPICFEVYAGRHMWKMTGSLGPHEQLETPAGKLGTVRIDLASVRLDDPRVKRTARFWISDDDKRLPVAALAEVRGKMLRAQLESASGRGWSLGRKPK